MWIIDILEKAGFSAYIVGGWVRDKELGFEAKDMDIATSALPEEIKLLFNRTIDTGIQHGTITVLSEDGVPFEVTTYRQDGEYSDSRHPDQVHFTTRIEDDLARRDFTINAMAWNSTTGLVDPFDGGTDLKNKIIRAVGDPIERFNEDALRMLRAVRFSATLGFQLEEKTKAAISSCASNILNISPERIRDELLKILLSDNPRSLILLREVGLLKHILPEFNNCFGVPQNNPWHRYDVGYHIIKVIENVPATKILRLTALMHDLGKPSTRTTDKKGIDHFYGHPQVSKNLAYGILNRLRFDNNTISTVCRLVDNHDLSIPENIKGVRRYISRLGIDLFLLYLSIRKADCKGQNLDKSGAEIEKLESIDPMVETILSEKQCVHLSDLAVNGNDLLDLGLKGEKIGVTLRHLLEIVIDEPSKNNKDELLRIISNNLESI